MPFERAKSIIGKTAVLEFKLVPESKTVDGFLEDGQDPCRLSEPDRGQKVGRANDRAGSAFQVLCGRESDPLTGRSAARAYLAQENVDQGPNHARVLTRPECDSTHDLPIVSSEERVRRLAGWRIALRHENLSQVHVELPFVLDRRHIAFGTVMLGE